MMDVAGEGQFFQDTATLTMMHRAILPLALVVLCSPAAWAETITLTSARDASLFESSGTRSNGAGGVVFTGTNSSGSPRRSLLWFDVAGGIPAGATIDSVQLTLTVAGVAGGGADPFPYVTGIYPVSRSWGEGTQGAGSGTAGSGQGFPTPSDGTTATWTHAFLADQPWTTVGGDFAATPSATALVAGTVGSSFTWGSTAAMVADVQGWLNNPAANFGWMVLGDEVDVSSFRSFHAREATNAALRPALAVTFTPVPEPSTFLLGAMALLGVGIVRLRLGACRR
jgi:hypothetical protein